MEKMTQKKWLLALLVTAATFFMLAVFWNQSYFPSDEEEIFVKGQGLAQGLLLYGDIGTQHMPLMYEIAALFSRLGVSTITGFRLSFYFLMALLWGLMFWRYQPTFGTRAMAAYPVLYILVLPWIDFGSCILSEQLQGIGMAILLFELLSFQRTNELKTGGCCMISLAIFLSFDSAFVSIFGIFAIGLTVLLMEVRTCRRQKTGVGKGLLYLVKRYWKLILIVALPFAVQLGYFAYTHTLYEFYGWAYQINREIYPKYLNGYAGNALQTLLNGIGTLGGAFSFSTVNTAALVRLALLFGAVLSLTELQRREGDAILTGGILFFLVTCATRGVFSFHGLPVIAVLCALGAVCLPGVGRICEKSVPRRAAALFCALVFGSAYLAQVPDLFCLELSSGIEEQSTAWYLDRMTEDGELVGMSTLDYDQLIQAGVLPASVTGGSCPWMWEWGGAQAMEELREQPPRVFLFNEGYSTWDYPLVDYAQELTQLIKDGYTPLSGYGQPTLYLRNDIYLETVQQLDPGVLFTAAPTDPGVPLLAGGEAAQTFFVEEDCELASLSLMVGTYERANECTLQVTLTDEATGRKTPLGGMDCRAMEDNAMNEIPIRPVPLLQGHSYTITISSPDASEENSVCLYYSALKAAESVFATVDGQRQDYNLCVEIRKG